MEQKLNVMLNQLQELYNWYIDKLTNSDEPEHILERIKELKAQINVLKELRGE